MTWLTPRLSKQVQILIPNQIPNAEGGADLVFGIPMGGAFDLGAFDHLAPVLTVWMGMKPVTFKGSGSKYIRGKQVNESVTHGFEVRSIEVSELGREFGKSFDIGFRFMPNLMGLKSDYFLLAQDGSSVKGRLFRIHDIMDNNEDGEYLNVAAEEIEERGTGFGA